MTKKIDLFYSALHIPVDAIAILLAFITSYWLRGDGTEIYKLPYQEYLTLVYRAAPIWLAIFVLQGMYAKRNLFASLQNFSHTAMTVLASWASFVVFLVFLKNEQTLVFPRLMLIYILVFGIVYVVGFRVILRVFRLLMRALGFGRTQLAVLGTSATAQALEDTLSDQRDLSVNFRKRFHLISPEELTKALRNEGVDQLIIADESLDNGKLFEYIRATQNAGVAVSVVPNMFEVQARNIVVETFAGLPLMTLRQTPLEGWGRIVKRGIDILLSSIALIVLSPVFVVVALLIAIFDSGPIFFAQKRIARGGKMMKIYKFRTMSSKWSGKPPLEVFKQLGRDDLVKEFEATQKVKDDPRVSRIGNFLRKTSLDELPQFVNVLRGELSLVGPRPIVEDELARYGRWGSFLLSIKPGITGLWQVSGRNDISYDERVQLDAHYVQNWSLWQDFTIMLKTIAVIFWGKTGY